jgi:hypothetical protein
MEIHFSGIRIPVTEIPNPGTGNNCLGYALGPMLKTDPEDLRWALCDFMSRAPTELQETIACSIIEDLDDVPEPERVSTALKALQHGCFVPADLFVAFCAMGHNRRKFLSRHNVIFFAKRSHFYEPVVFHREVGSTTTQYIGCDEVHYEALQGKFLYKLDRILFSSDVTHGRHDKALQPATAAVRGARARS